MPTWVHHVNTTRVLLKSKKKYRIASHRVAAVERRLTSYPRNRVRRSSTCPRSATCTASTPIQSCNTSIHYRSRSNTNRSSSSLRRRNQNHSPVSLYNQVKYLFLDTINRTHSDTTNRSSSWFHPEWSSCFLGCSFRVPCFVRCVKVRARSLGRSRCACVPGFVDRLEADVSSICLS